MALHPTSVSNTFLRHLVFWGLFVPLLSTIFVPLVIHDQNISKDEVAMVESLDVDIGELNASTNENFSKWFVETGIMPGTEKFFSMHSPGTIEGNMPSNWIRGVWLIVYKAIWRMHALWLVFFLPSLALCVPAVIDGLMIHARKKYEFVADNGTAFYASTHVVVLVVGLFIYMPLAPLTLSFKMLGCMIVGVAVAAWVAAANFRTGS